MRECGVEALQIYAVSFFRCCHHLRCFSFHCDRGVWVKLAVSLFSEHEYPTTTTDDNNKQRKKYKVFDQFFFLLLLVNETSRLWHIFFFLFLETANSSGNNEWELILPILVFFFFFIHSFSYFMASNFSISCSTLCVWWLLYFLYSWDSL